jgi:hypothetical protein
MKKTLILFVITASMLGAAIMTIATKATAHKTSNIMAERIASRFNLDKTEVEKQFDELHKEHKAEHSVRFNNYLQVLVDEGKLTPEQKTAVLEKFTSLQVEHKSIREELENWADQNGIDIKYLRINHWHAGSLERATANGEITNDQLQLIEAKQAEIEAKYNQRKLELEAWAKELGIDLTKLLPFQGRHGRGIGMQTHF